MASAALGDGQPISISIALAVGVLIAVVYLSAVKLIVQSMDALLAAARHESVLPDGHNALARCLTFAIVATTVVFTFAIGRWSLAQLYPGYGFW